MLPLVQVKRSQCVPFLLTYEQAGNKVVLCTASTGVAALLLADGLAAETFNIPFGDSLTEEGSSCNVSSLKASALKFFVERTLLLFWDEIPMSNKNLLEKHLISHHRDSRRNNLHPFTPVPLTSLSGDWRQVGPVSPSGTPHDVVDAALICPGKHVQRFRLMQSMRDRLDKR